MDIRHFKADAQIISVVQQMCERELRRVPGVELIVDRLMHDVVFEFTQYGYGQRRRLSVFYYDVPETWWDHFKHDHYEKWWAFWIRRWCKDVEYARLEKSEEYITLCPHVESKAGAHYRFMTCDPVKVSRRGIEQPWPPAEVTRP